MPAKENCPQLHTSPTVLCSTLSTHTPAHTALPPVGLSSVPTHPTFTTTPARPPPPQPPGDRTYNLFWRLLHGELPRVRHPKAVLLLIGTNDLGLVYYTNEEAGETVVLQEVEPTVHRRGRGGVGCWVGGFGAHRAVRAVVL